jgi:putative spermidine/putrescine transport system substrate-binding protein
MKFARAIGGAALALTVVGTFAYVLLSRRPPVLTVVTWAGSYGRAQASALFVPYSQKAGINVHIAEYDGGLDELRRGHPNWDVFDLELPDAIAACQRGLLEPLGAIALPSAPNGETASVDFVTNARGPCWIGSVVYSQIIAYDPRRFGDARPKTVSDFFDLERFPGPRALRGSSAKYNLELALLADGVAPRDVYSTLSTEQGVQRAFAKLDTIRSSLVWWTRSDEPVRMLVDGRAAFSTTLNGNVYDAAMHHQALGVIWDHQLYELDVFGVPRRSSKSTLARDFVRFATSTASLAHIASWVPYGPARRSSLSLVGPNPELGISMRPFLPTTAEHFSKAFPVDDAWWLAHGDEMASRWQAWRLK